MEGAQALGQADPVLLPATHCCLVSDKSFTSLGLSCHLEWDENDAETCVTGWSRGPSRGATWREEAVGAVEGPGCFVPAGGQGQEGGLRALTTPPRPPGQALHLGKVPGRVRGAEPH